MRLNAYLPAMLACLLPYAAHAAGPMQAYELRNLCRETVAYFNSGAKPADSDFEHGLNYGRCIGIVQAAVQTYVVIKQPTQDVQDPKRLEDQFCLPSGWTTEQGIKTFLAWADKNPKAMSMSAEGGVLLSHLTAYPCQPHAARPQTKPAKPAKK